MHQSAMICPLTHCRISCVIEVVVCLISSDRLFRCVCHSPVDRDRHLSPMFWTIFRGLSTPDRPKSQQRPSADVSATPTSRKPFSIRSTPEHFATWLAWEHTQVTAESVSETLPKKTPQVLELQRNQAAQTVGRSPEMIQF